MWQAMNNYKQYLPFWWDLKKLLNICKEQKTEEYTYTIHSCPLHNPQYTHMCTASHLDGMFPHLGKDLGCMGHSLHMMNGKYTTD